jgi:hypothetical protein
MDKVQTMNDLKISLKQFCVYWARWKFLGSCADDHKARELLGYDAILTSNIFPVLCQLQVLSRFSPYLPV